jgi:hypothetical protein
MHANPALPITDRDYFLSKQYQFLLVTVLDSASAGYGDAADRLTRALDEIFPVGADLSRLWLLDWGKLMADCDNFDPHVLVRSIAAQMPSHRPVSPPGNLGGNEEYRGPKEVIDQLRGDESIEALAERAGLNPNQVYRVRKGLDVRVSTLVTLATALGCAPGELIP